MNERRKIPRPWLERRQISAQEKGQPPPFVFSSAGVTGSVRPLAPPPPLVLLERPNPLKSFLKLDWCCGNKQQPPKPQQLPPPPQQPELYTPSSPLILSERSIQQHKHQDSCDSSFQLLPRPTIIYVIQGDPSTIPSTKEIQDQWHQSYLSSFGTSIGGSLRPEKPSMVQRSFSWDTSCTTLSADDSLAFSDEIIPPAISSSLRSSSRQLPPIPRPPRVQKSKTAGSVLSRRPPMAPKPPRTRSATMDSLISTGSLHRRQVFSVDQDTVEKTFSFDSFNLDDDDDDDDSLALKSSDGESPIFPLLERRRSSPRSQDSEKLEPELYLPKCATLEARSPKSKTIVFSGWVAFSKGDSLLHKRKVTRKHLGYLVVYEDEPNEIYLQQPPTTDSGQGTGEEEPRETVTIKLPAEDVSVQTEECTGGRSVVIRSSSSKILCTILPMNLPSSIFNPTCSKIVRGPLPPPVPSFAQHDAALHLWFGLDGWMRRRSQQQSCKN